MLLGKLFCIFLLLIIKSVAKNIAIDVRVPTDPMV